MAFLALAAMLGLFQVHTTTDARTIQLGRWSLELAADRFTGTIACRLRVSKAVFDEKAATFEFGHSVDTSDAFYRIEDGPVLAWRSLIPSLVAQGVKVQNDDLANPSGGRVPIPLKLLSDARSVEIRPDVHHRPKLFKLNGLQSAIERANERGCHFWAEGR
jgi:hypothetical protein